MSVLGFGFWIFVAHLYTPSQIGIASALISITTLLSNLSLLGLNAGLVRFLPKSANQSADINAAMCMVGGVTIAAAAGYVLIASLLGSNVSLLATNWHKIAFVLLMATVSLNSLTDSVFIANRRAELHTAAYAVLGVVKLLLPLLLIPLGSLGIFSAYMIAMIVSLLFSLYLMRRWCGYRFRSAPNWALLKKVRTYATNNYLGTVLGGLPSQLMPMLIIRQLGSAEVAYFSMAWTMANLLYVVPSAATQSLLAESSHDPAQKSNHLRHTIKILSLILAPLVLLAVTVAPFLLRIFGAQYSSGGTAIFQIFALTTLPMAITSLSNTVLNLEQRSSGIVASQVAQLVATFGSVGFLVHLGLPGVGLSILLGSLASCLTHLCIALLRRRKVRIATKGAHFAITTENLRTLLQAYSVGDFTYSILGNGSSNHTLLITQQERQSVLRIYKPQGKTVDDIVNEIRFVHFLASHSLPVPSTVASKTGHLISTRVVDGTRWYYLLMAYETGTHPTRYSPELMQRMAFYQAKIHIVGADYARHAAQHTGTKQQTSWSLLPSTKLRGYSHFDFDGSNILVKDGHITSILDFEGMRYGLLVGCLYFTLTRIYDRHRSIEQLRAYIDAYQRARGLSLAERLILRTALVLHYRSPRMLFLGK